jgi:hypothetical protein
MPPARARLEALSKDLKAYEDQIRDDMKEIRASLRRIKWALRIAGILGVLMVVLLVATVVRPLSRQLKQIVGKIEQLENQEVVAALTDVAKLRAAIQAETQRIETETHSHISETVERSRNLSAQLQSDLAKLSPNGEAFPDVYSAARQLETAVEKAGEKLGPEGQFPPLLQKASALNAKLDSALVSVEGPETRGHRKEFPPIYDRASALQARLATAQQRLFGAAPGQPEPPFPDVFANAASLDNRLAAAYRKATGAERGKPEPAFPDLYKQAASTQRKLKKASDAATPVPTAK